MFGLIARVFVKDYKNINSGKVRESYGQLAGTIGILCNILLFVSKLVAGITFHSISVVADAINNISDALSSLVTVASFRMSNKPADKDHPYGHRRIEYVATMIVSFGIILFGYELLKTSIDKLIHPTKTVFSYFTIGVLVGSILIKLFMNRMYGFYAKVIDSTVLKASAQDSINDVISTGAVLVCAVLAKITNLELDSIVAIAVSLFIVWSGVKLVRETLDPLLGMAPDTELVDKIEHEIMSYDKIIGIHDLMLHTYGPNMTYASVHAEIPYDVDVLQSHDVLDKIERHIKQVFGINMIIHLDPVITDDEYINKTKQTVVEILYEISDQISLHDFRIINEDGKSRFVFDVETPYNFKLRDEALDELIKYKISQKLGDDIICDVSYDKK